MSSTKILNLTELMDSLGDPIRFKIFTEIFMHHERTATQLLDVLPINRSTLSHHLTKLVDNDILRVRVNPTGRAVKYYSLKIAFHKVDFRQDYSGKSYEEKRKFMNLLLQQIAFELRVASNHVERIVQRVVESDQVEDLNFKQGHLQFSLGKRERIFQNGGIFYTTKDHLTEFLEEITPIIQKFKEEVFEMASTETFQERDHAVVIGGFPLENPIQIKAKRIVKKNNA